MVIAGALDAQLAVAPSRTDVALEEAARLLERRLGELGPERVGKVAVRPSLIALDERRRLEVEARELDPLRTLCGRCQPGLITILRTVAELDDRRRDLDHDEETIGIGSARPAFS